MLFLRLTGMDVLIIGVAEKATGNAIVIYQRHCCAYGRLAHKQRRFLNLRIVETTDSATVGTSMMTPGTGDILHLLHDTR